LSESLSRAFRKERIVLLIYVVLARTHLKKKKKKKKKNFAHVTRMVVVTRGLVFERFCHCFRGVFSRCFGRPSLHSKQTLFGSLLYPESHSYWAWFRLNCVVGVIPFLMTECLPEIAGV
jgi:hypothetical protein